MGEIQRIQGEKISVVEVQQLKDEQKTSKKTSAWIITKKRLIDKLIIFSSFKKLFENKDILHIQFHFHF
jgi:hypothetical protein